MIVCHENDKLERLICHDSARLSSFANGNGTPRSYWRRLLQRTQQEMQIYERTRRELENEKNAAVWEEKNMALRRLGLRPIPNPKDED